MLCDLDGIGHLLCDLSAIVEKDEMPLHHRSLYFLDNQTLAFAKTIRAHLEKQP